MSMTHYLKEYARFQTIEEMDAAAEQHVMIHYDEMTNSDRQVLDVIRPTPLNMGLLI